MYVYCYLLSLKNYPKIVVPGVPDCVTSGSETFSALFLGPCNTQNMVKTVNERAQMILQNKTHFQQNVSTEACPLTIATSMTVFELCTAD